MLKNALKTGSKTELVILLYAGFFILSSFSGVSLLGEKAWAPYIQSTSNSNAPSGAAWIEGRSLHWADGSTEYYTDHNYNARGNYHLDSGSGSTAVDSSGNNNDGFINGSATWITGKYDNALSFSGDSGEGIDLGHIWDDHGTAVTISFWYKGDSSASSGDRIISQDCSEWFCVTDDGTDAIRITMDNTGNTISATETQWHHVALVFNPTESTADAYLDGSKVLNDVALDSWNHANRPIVFAGNTEGYGDISGGEWEGDIDEIRIYNAVLNPAIIKELASGEGGKVSGQSGSVWVEGNQVHWIDSNSRERIMLGMDTGANPSGATAGNAWMESSGFRYIDANGNERRSVPRDCQDVSGGSGAYSIDPDGSGGVAPFEVYCEMSENGGGWVRVYMDNAGKDHIWAASYSSSNDIFKCGVNELKYYDNRNGLGEDWVPGSTDVTKTFDIDYRTAGTILTESQENALRTQLSALSSTTRSVGFTCDDDGGTGNDHNAFLRTESGNDWVSQDGYVDGSNYEGWWLHHTNSANNYFETSNSFTSVDTSRTPPSAQIMPAKVKLQIGSGGGTAWGYEDDYGLVK